MHAEIFQTLADVADIGIPEQIGEKIRVHHSFVARVGGIFLQFQRDQIGKAVKEVRIILMKLLL